MSKRSSVHRVPPLGTGRVGPQAAALIEAGQAESLGDGLGEQLDDITEATDAVRAFLRCADSGTPGWIRAAGAAVGAAVAVGGSGEGYVSHEIVAVPPLADGSPWSQSLPLLMIVPFRRSVESPLN